MSANPTSRNVPILSLSQALALSGPPMVALLGGLLGTLLAPTPALATLPVAMQVVGLALATIPAALWMRRVGRRRGFQSGAAAGFLAALLAALALYQSNFWLFCSATLLIGASSAFVQQYRFAAAESVPAEKAGRAVSWVLLGGIAAGYLGPQIANQARDWLPWGAFTGSFVALAIIYLLVLVLLSGFRDVRPSEQETQGAERPLGEIARQPLFLLAMLCGAVGYGVMSFIMTATPLHMHTHSGFSLPDTTFVIQSHIIAMYLPSFFSGLLIERLGVLRVMYAGLAALLICVLLAVFSQELVEYWAALVLLGVGWNFLFVGATVLLTRTYLPTERFKAQALNDFVIFGTQALTSLSSGTVLFMASWDLLNLLNLPVLLVTAVLLALLARRVRARQPA
jgi:predicted MFS family arabinose efflux permease